MAMVSDIPECCQHCRMVRLTPKLCKHIIPQLSVRQIVYMPTINLRADNSIININPKADNCEIILKISQDQIIATTTKITIKIFSQGLIIAKFTVKPFQIITYSQAVGKKKKGTNFKFQPYICQFTIAVRESLKVSSSV